MKQSHHNQDTLGASPVGRQHEPATDGAESPEVREHFIPILKSELIDQLAASDMLSDDHRSPFRSLCKLLEATIHYQFHDELEGLKHCYSRFDPDRSTISLNPTPTESHDSAMADLFQRFDRLLQAANYQRLERHHIEQAIGAASDWGVRLHVDLEQFDRLEVYVRGDTIGRRARRRWQNLYRPEEVDVPLYQQLAVIFRLRPPVNGSPNPAPEPVHIKLFKNIPKQDIDMLLPGSRVKMTLVDQSRILLPTISGAVLSIYKVIKVIAFASLYGMFVFLAAVCGTLGYGVKSFLGYLRTKDKYQHHLTKSLYYQNLDNNAGVLCRLLDEAEEQEFREAITAYALLWCRGPQEGWTCAEIDEEAERLLHGWCGIHVDFEVDDAIKKLEQFGLAAQLGTGRWRAVPIDHALRDLDAAWDRYFQFPDVESRSP